MELHWNLSTLVRAKLLRGFSRFKKIPVFNPISNDQPDVVLSEQSGSFTAGTKTKAVSSGLWATFTTELATEYTRTRV